MKGKKEGKRICKKFMPDRRIARESRTEHRVHSILNIEYRAPYRIRTCFAVETDHQWFRLLGVDAERRKRRVVYPKRDEAMMKLRKIYA